MIDSATVHSIALLAANEDYCGLYELIWELNTEYPQAGMAQKLAVARATVVALLAEGLLELFSARWLDREYRPVPMAEGAAILAQDASWRAPNETTNGTFFAFSATEAGRRAWRRLSAF